MKKLNKFLSLILAVCLLMGMMALPVSAATENTAGISKDKTAEWHDASQTIADVTLSVPGNEVDVSSDIVFIIGHGPAHNYGYIMDMIHKMLVAADGTPTKIKIGMVGYADTTEDETVLPLTEMKDTVPGNEVADYRLENRYNDGSKYTETLEDYNARKAEYEAKIADLLEETPALADDMEYIIARALEKAEAVYTGVNMESALITARDMLAADETVPADRKHMIVISTGLTYWFDNDDDKGSFIVRNNGGGVPQQVNYKYWLQHRNGTTSTTWGYRIPTSYKNDSNTWAEAWTAYWNDIVGWIENDQNKYVYSVRDTYTAFTNRAGKNATIVDKEDLALVNKENGKYVLAPDCYTMDSVLTANGQHAVGYERAQYEAWVVYKQMETAVGETFTTALGETIEGLGFNCYSVAIGKTPGPGDETNWLEDDQIGYNFMRMLGGENTVNYNSGDLSFFKSIENKVLLTCAAGSYVEDYIGYENNANDGFNFDFLVNGKITLTVGTTEYTTTKLETAKAGFDASYTFTAPGAAEATFTLDYVKGNGTTEEKFIWTFGEDIQTFAPAKLNYQVELVECRMPEGTAAEGYLVKTNQNAMLYPVGGEAEAFPIPELTVLPMYTVTYEYVGVIPENAPEVPAAKDYVVGTKVDTAAAPELEGYDFFGWNNPHTNDVTFDMPAHDITITGYWLPVNDHVDPPIGIKTDKEKGEGYQYDVTISVPGDGEEVKIHDEVILIIDASYSCDEEWADMKANIIEIGKNVLGGVGRTQMTVISFGMGDYVVAEGVKTVEDLTALLPELPGGLLYGRSSTNCESGFTGAMEYIQSKESELSKVDVIYISDFGVNTDETERVFDDWQTLATKFGPLTVAQAAFEGAVTYGENLPAAFSVFGDRFDGITGEEILTAAFTNGEVTDEEFLAFADQLWADVYAYSGLIRGEEYPVSTVERAFVKYDKENGTYIQDAFYYTTYNSKYVTYNDRWNRSTEAGKLLAAMPIVNELYMVRYGNHAQGWWAKNVTGAKYYSADSVAGLLEVLKPMTEELSQTNYTNVVITDYMSKWVLLHTDSIYVQNDTTGEIIWTIKDGWLSETDRPTSKTPVTYEKVDPADYAAGGDDVIGNTNGDIYVLTWNVKDDCLLRTDNYSLHYVVTVDIDEPGFVPGQEFPANGNTFVDYEKDGHNDIQVPDVTIPAYTVTYLNGQIQLQKTEAHKTGDEIPACETPASYTENGYRYTFARWSLRSGVEGENNTVGNTDLVYEAVYTATLDETQVTVEKIWDDDDDFEGARPENITIRLWADGVEIDSVVVTEEMGWSYTFEKLPVYADGQKIVYTVTEDAVEGYEMIELSGDAENGFKIVNQYLIVVDDPEPPTTGDPIALVLALSVISVLGMAVIVLQRKKFN